MWVRDEILASLGQRVFEEDLLRHLLATRCEVPKISVAELIQTWLANHHTCEVSWHDSLAMINALT